MKNKFIFGLFFCLVIYVFLSWILLFRDERALNAIESFYPFLNSSTTLIRIWLSSHGLNLIPTLMLTGVIGAGFFFYWKTVWQKLEAKKIILIAVLLQIIVFFSYPVLSTDIHDYILTNRVALVHKANVWVTPPTVFKNDPYYDLASWQKQTSPYGAVNQYLYFLPGILGGNDFFWNLAIYKLFVMGFVFGSLYLSYLILKNYFSDRLSFGLSLVFLNPLFILETAGSAHNQIIMIFFTLLAVFYFLKKNLLLTGVFLGAAVQVKFIPVILAVFIGVHLLQDKKIKSLIYFLFAFVTINFLAFLPTGTGLITYLTKILVGEPIYWQSLPMLVHKVFSMEKLIFLSAFIIELLFFTFLVWQKKMSAIMAYLYSVLIFLLFLTNFYWNWYILWLLPLVPMIFWGKLSKTVVLMTLTSALAYPLYYFSLRFNYQHLVWPVIIYLLIAGLPTGYYLYEKFFKKK